MSSDTVMDRSGGQSRMRPVIVVLIALAAVAALLALMGPAHLLLPSSKGAGSGLSELRSKIDKIKTPALAVMGSLSGLGVVAGLTMASIGITQGIRIAVTAGLAGGGYLLAMGLIK